MKYLLKAYCHIFFILFIFSGCAKRNFFPDQDDPGLSRFTSYGYNITTVYINNVPYINLYRGLTRGNEIPRIDRIYSGGSSDTLKMTWSIERNDSTQNNYPSFQQISLLIPVPNTFVKNDFLTFNDLQSFSDRIEIDNSYNTSSSNSMKGNAAVYFVKSSTDSSGSGTKYYSFTGLFNGNIGDSIIMTKGRFDFRIPENNINF